MLDPEAFPGQMRCINPQAISGSTSGFTPCWLGPSKGRQQGSILIRYLNHLSWLLFNEMEQQLYSFRMSRLHTPFLSPATLRRETYFPDCIRDSLSFGHSSGEVWSGKLKALPSISAHSSLRPACRPHSPLSCHSWTRPQDTWVPSLGGFDGFLLCSQQSWCGLCEASYKVHDMPKS